MLIDFPLLIIDESTDARITAALIKEGFDVFTVQQNSPGISDLEVIQIAIEKGGYILTEDKDFGDELVYRNGAHNGALLIRLSGIAIDEKIKIVLSALQKNAELLPNAFAVLTSKKLRIRKKDSL